MPLTQEASTLTLDDVDRLLKLERRSPGVFTDFLTVEPLSEFEQQDLLLTIRLPPILTSINCPIKVPRSSPAS